MTVTRISKEFAISGWTIGATVSLGTVMVGLAWEISPPGIFLTLPLLDIWIERAETDYQKPP